MRENLSRHIAVGLALFGVAVMAAQAAAPSAPQGVITAKKWLNIGGGTAVSDLTSNARFPDSPDLVEYPSYFELNATGDINTSAPDWADNYGAQMAGYFYPNATGDYVFYLCSDDGGNLYLSTDDNPANKKLIAQEAGWSGTRSYLAIGGTSTVEAKCSQTFTGTEWPTKDPWGGAKITLQAGKAYYIEALFKEGGGGDNLSVSIDGSLPIPGSMLSSIDKTTGPVKIVTQPQSQTVDEGQPVTFSVEADGTPPYTYQWKKNGADITGATGQSYTLARVAYADNGAKFSVVVTGAQGTVTSADAVLTVNQDKTPPTLVSASGSVTFDTVTVAFSEPVDPTTAQTTANYQISGGLTVSAAVLGAAPNDNVVVLTTSKQAEGATLTLTVNNVKDAAGNAIAANSQIQFRAFVFLAGAVLHQKYNNVDDGTGSNPDNLFADPRYPSAPDRRDLVWMWEYPPGGATRVAADPARNYFDTLEGFFIPPKTGDYVFFIAGADRWWLYLSTDDSPANKYLIAAEPGGWTEPRYWNTTHDTDPARHRTDMSPFNQWPTAPTITLTAGKRYYMLEVHHDPSWCGADDFSATYKLESEPDPMDGDAPRLTGSVVGAYVDPTGSSVNITQQPTNTTQEEQRTATFTVIATGASPYGGTVNYQWQKLAPQAATWSDITAATRSSYTTPILELTDSGTKYRVICSVPTVTVTSAEATLTVVPDTFPPKVTAAGSVQRASTGAIEIGVGFDENVDATTAGSVANYTLSKGTVTGVRYQNYDHTDGAGFFQLGSAGPFKGAAVVLTTSGLAPGDTVTLTVKNIKDIKGNTMAAQGETKTVTITRKMKWAAMGGTDYLEGETGGQNITSDPALWPDDVIAYSDADFDLISGGTANWNNYDEATFVYEEVTGNFDKVVRVEYHDPTSQWARAGLCATPNADEGVTRAQVNAGYSMAKRFMMRANPAVQWSGVAGNNMYEYDYRQMDGGNYGGGGAGTPAYPTAWLRMQRRGQTFNALYSNDGMKWTSYGSFTFTDNPGTSELMPDKLLVGPYYSPEFGNNNTGQGVGHSSVAKFRQYGDFTEAITPTISAAVAADGKVTLTYTGTLVSSPAVTGPYAPVADATSPYTVDPKTLPTTFYQSKR